MSDDLTPERRAELRRLHASECDGEWAVRETVTEDDGGRWREHHIIEARAVIGEASEGAATLACAAVNALPALLDAADERDRLRQKGAADLARMLTDALDRKAWTAHDPDLNAALARLRAELDERGRLRAANAELAAALGRAGDAAGQVAGVLTTWAGQLTQQHGPTDFGRLAAAMRFAEADCNAALAKHKEPS